MHKRHELRSRLNDLLETPEDFCDLMAELSQLCGESESELQSAWTDPHAGRVWREFGKIADRAAASAQRAIDKYV